MDVSSFSVCRDLGLRVYVCVCLSLFPPRLWGGVVVVVSHVGQASLYLTIKLRMTLVLPAPTSQVLELQA